MPILIIAEIGINHNGDLEIAKKLIGDAVLVGCDAVKFQKRTPAICVPENQRNVMRETPWGYISYLEYRNKIEFSKREYDVIDDYCRQKGIVWFASSWDIPSQLFLRQYNLKYNKVASPMLTNMPLLEVIAEEGLYTFISTGMSTYQDIDKAIEIFKKHNCPFELMHCNSVYPMKEEDANLKMITTLRERYGGKVGYSGHEVGLIVTCAAAALGATSIERHITLNHAMWGTDHAASVEPTGFARLVRYIRGIEVAMGDGVKRITPDEQTAADRLRYFRADQLTE